MTIVLTNVTLPERGRVDINVSFEITITAEEAKRKVTWWLREEVSMLIYGETPTLVVGERPVWRVPAWIAFPSTGPAGQVGFVDVDAETGEIRNISECKAEIEKQAEAIAQKLPPFRLRELPADYMPKHIPPSPLLTLPEESASDASEKR